MFKVLPHSSNYTLPIDSDFFSEDFTNMDEKELHSKMILFLRQCFRNNLSLPMISQGKHTIIDYANQLPDSPLKAHIKEYLTSHQTKKTKYPENTPSHITKLFLDFQNKASAVTMTRLQKIIAMEQIKSLEQKASRCFSQFSKWEETGITKENTGNAYENLLKLFKKTQIIKSGEGLFKFFETKKYDQIKIVLLNYPHFINMPNIHKETLLFLAVQSGNTDLTQFLLEHDAKLTLSLKPFVVITPGVLEKHPALTPVFIEHFNRTKDIKGVMFLLENMMQFHLNDQVDTSLMALTRLCKNEGIDLDTLYISGTPLTLVAIFNKNDTALQLLFEYGFPLLDLQTKSIKYDQYHKKGFEDCAFDTQILQTKYREYNTPILAALQTLLSPLENPLYGEVMLDILLAKLTKIHKEKITEELCRPSFSGSTIFTLVQEAFERLTTQIKENTQTVGDKQVHLVQKKWFLFQVFNKVLDAFPETPTREFLKRHGMTNEELLDLFQRIKVPNPLQSPFETDGSAAAGEKKETHP